MVISTRIILCFIHMESWYFQLYGCLTRFLLLNWHTESIWLCRIWVSTYTLFCTYWKLLWLALWHFYHIFSISSEDEVGVLFCEQSTDALKLHQLQCTSLLYMTTTIQAWFFNKSTRKMESDSELPYEVWIQHTFYLVLNAEWKLLRW